MRFIVIRDWDTWHGAGLEFNIVESGENARVALLNLFDAMEGYVESCRKVKGSRLAPLNQTPDSEYAKLWDITTASKEIKSPYEISTFGVVKV